MRGSSVAGDPGVLRVGERRSSLRTQQSIALASVRGGGRRSPMVVRERWRRRGSISKSRSLPSAHDGRVEPSREVRERSDSGSRAALRAMRPGVRKRRDRRDERLRPDAEAKCALGEDVALRSTDLLGAHLHHRHVRSRHAVGAQPALASPKVRACSTALHTAVQLGRPLPSGWSPGRSGARGPARRPAGDHPDRRTTVAMSAAQTLGPSRPSPLRAQERRIW